MARPQLRDPGVRPSLEGSTGSGGLPEAAVGQRRGGRDRAGADKQLRHPGWIKELGRFPDTFTQFKELFDAEIARRLLLPAEETRHPAWRPAVRPGGHVGFGGFGPALPKVARVVESEDPG
ncbi:hypothetical protein [Corynebacterium sp. A21]|uniref:hypothetical protein n=1 Tax=Corynebacterium sp. A21 TaxID=3457318 RepID=UPI003FD519D2